VNRNQLRWYVWRASRMSLGEAAGRARDHARRRAWRRRQVHPAQAFAPVEPGHPRPFPTTIDPATANKIPEAARTALLASADRLLSGEWELLGAVRDDIVLPDWFFDPSTGTHAPQSRYAFRVAHRSEAETGNVRQLWELSRHQHLTMLAAAWYVSGDDRYAETVAAQLESWWNANPFLSGVHWTSGIEVGLRLVAWTWIRRLLDGWDGAVELFEHNETAVRQIAWHQDYLAGFRSHGSSANNHAVAEAAGQLIASIAMPWFASSPQRQARAQADFEREVRLNTFASGVNRELASGYHLFVAELAFLAALECDAAGVALAPATWIALCRMTDAAAALIDEAGRPPRQGDSDDAVGLRVDGAAANGWTGLLDLGAQVFGSLPWWPEPQATALSTLAGSLARSQPTVAGRLGHRPSHFADAGITLLRTPAGPPGAHRPELWCRCDAGPHGFLSTAAHAHADALSIEVRHGGVEILADPGTYCYHGEAPWRSYFRSTLGHNALEIDGRHQSRSGGAFLWIRHANARVSELGRAADGEIESWAAEHDGYAGLEPAVTHRRRVSLDRDARQIEIVDEVEAAGSSRLRLAFHFGPAVSLSHCGAVAHLQWPGASGPSGATLHLPDSLVWTAHRGDTEPILGWYSPGFGVKVPSDSLVGSGTTVAGSRTFTSVIRFHE
jgi:hypothetical protein